MKTLTPWFRKQTGCWYVEVAGKQLNLGKDREAAFRKAADLTSRTGGTARHVLAKFSAWVAANRAPRTAEWYERHLQPFLDACGSTDVQRLTREDVNRWLDRIRGNHNTKRGAIVAVKTAFRWLVKNEYLDKSPVANVEVPTGTPSEDCLTPEQMRLVEAAAKGTVIEDVVVVLRQTGCRPQELRAVEAQHVSRNTWTFPVSLSKGKRRRRVVRMTPTVQAIVDRLVLKHPAGPIFRNSKGKPWSKNSLALAFHRISKKAGFRVYTYALRHTFATDALVAGVDPISVGLLMGHRDGGMVSRVYSHLTQREDHLQASLAKALS